MDVLTAVLTAIADFFRTPIGGLVMLVLGGAATYLSSTLKAKGDASKKVEQAKAEIEAAAAERERQNNKDRETVRKMLGQVMTELLKAERETMTETREQLLVRERESAENLKRINDLQGQIAALNQRVVTIEKERDVALAEVSKAKGELEERNRTIELLGQDLEKTKNELEVVKGELAIAKDRLNRLEHGTTPSPDVDSVQVVLPESQVEKKEEKDGDR